MGMRGPGARPKGNLAEAVESEGVQPWEAEGLSRSERVIVFLESLPITSGPLAGKPLKLRRFQIKFVRAVYGTNGKGERAVRTAVLSLARKNGKTQLAAGLALCHLSGPEAEDRGEVYSAANDRFQAARIFREMVAIIDRVSWLRRRINVRSFTKELEDMWSGSVYAALSADVATKHGLSPSFVVYDELGQAAKRDLYDALDTAMGGRAEPLMVVISTQAANDLAPLSLLIDYGKRVNAGEFKDPSFHLTFYTAPDDADPWALKTWEMANPALKDFRSLEDVKRLAEQARRTPAKESAFRNLILNQRIAAEARFIDAIEWKACAGKAEIAEGSEIYAGLDLGGTRDLSALALVHRNDGGVFHAKMRFWLPGDVHDRTEQDRVPYDAWVRAGLLQSIGKTTDPEVIALAIAELSSQYRIKVLAYDRWGITDLKRELDAIGCGVPLLAFGQGYKDMGPAVDTLETAIAEKRLRHGGNPVLGMCAANAIVTKDPTGKRKLDKAKSIGRIDGLVALAMAVSAASRHQAVSIESMIP